jgi:ATP-dependent helicase/nuclease subunit B
MPSVTVARVPSTSDPVAALASWLKERPPGLSAILWLVPSEAVATDLRIRVARQLGTKAYSTHIADVQSYADEICRYAEANIQPLQPRHWHALAAGKEESVTNGEAARLAKTVEELKRAGIKLNVKKLSADLRKRVAAWEKLKKKLGRLDEEDRIQFAVERLRKNPDTMHPRTLVLSGFDASSANESELISALLAKVEAVAVVLPPDQSLPGWFDDDDVINSLSAESLPAAVVHRIEAPGPLGESRLVARQLREWIDAGVDPANVVVTARHTERFGDLLAATFAEYGLTLAGVESPPLSRTHSVAALLHAWRLPLDGFPFEGVSEILRSNFFRPKWPECQNDPALPDKADTLLRRLDRPSGKASFLGAVEQWVVSPMPLLEDEAGERSRRERLEALAGHCRAFLQRFFQSWDDDAAPRSPAKWVERLRSFAATLGFPSDPQLRQFGHELDDWTNHDAPALGLKRLSLEQVTEQFERIAAVTPAMVSSPMGRAIRLLAPEDACRIPCDILVVLDLGEGSFPDASPPVSLLSDLDRLRLQTDLLPTAELRLERERRLFAGLLTRPKSKLLLSRQAVDDMGQELLPSSFLLDWVANRPDLSPPVRQKMTIEGYAEGPAYSKSERRVQAARLLRANQTVAADHDLSDDVLETLKRSQWMAAKRFRSSEFSPFDGLLEHPETVAAIAKKFGPERTFSPSVLETYVACPFRFWLEQVLRIEPLETPSSEVEATRRGQAVHRAMARYHTSLRDGGNPDLQAMIAETAAEYGNRSGTPALKVLWQLEGRRLQRSAKKYAAQWEKFQEDWKDAVPVPTRFEQSFGMTRRGESGVEPLVIDVNGVSVKIGGTIDRVDTVELDGERGFWVIDYKTGRASSHTGTDVLNFAAMQLPLYALAVEKVVLKDRPARPLGLAYWLVSDGGPKTVLPGGRPVTKWLHDAEVWPKFREQLEAWVATLVANIRRAAFPLAPRSDQCTATCPFGPTCRISQSRSVGKVFEMNTAIT